MIIMFESNFIYIISFCFPCIEIDSDEFHGEVMLKDVVLAKHMESNPFYFILPGDRRGAAGFDSSLYW